MKIYRNQYEVTEDCNDGDLIVDDDVQFLCDVRIEKGLEARTILAQDIYAGLHIIAKDIIAGDVSCCELIANDINVRDLDVPEICVRHIRAANIEARSINCNDINALDLQANIVCADDIYARTISAKEIYYQTFCVSYERLSCRYTDSGIKGVPPISLEDLK